jgi:hypothetical protein
MLLHCVHFMEHWIKERRYKKDKGEKFLTIFDLSYNCDYVTEHINLEKLSSIHMLECILNSDNEG